MIHKSTLLKALPLLFACAVPSVTQTGASNFVNFEGSLTSPIRLSQDGNWLFTVNSPNATISVFDVSGVNSAKPRLYKVIPVGLEPVSVNPRTNDEVWVVNQVSDSISVVSVSKGIVVDTLQAKDEPADVVFAGSHAFVSTARNNQILAFDTNTHALVQTISVFGGAPRAMAVSADGSTVYAAMALSGNQTTVIPWQISPPPPPPVNPLLPPAPPQDIIVRYNDPAWARFIKYTMPDNDVVAISSSSLAVVNYFTNVGTINQAIAVQPGTGNIFVGNMDLLNTIRFENKLTGHFVNNRISKITPAGAVMAYDLNPGFTYQNMPNASELANALAEPTSIVFDSTGQNMYVAAFGTDRVAKVDANGNILARIEIEPTATGSQIDSVNKRGPRGLAINNAANVLYVMNRISNTISVIDTSLNTVTSEFPTGPRDPTPAVIKSGRGFLYDAKLSGSGTGSCASCHVDGEADHLAWDLGNPTGNLIPVTVQGGAIEQLHPMKGPMVTMTLRGLLNAQPYHWRGDKATFNDFNVAFQSLMGGNQLTTSQMQAYTDFINTVVYMPNPLQNLDRSYPTKLTIQGAPTGALGDAVRGQHLFMTEPASVNNQTCNHCHTTANGIGSNLAIQHLSGEPQSLKVPQLRIMYQKTLFNMSGPTIDGIGVTTEGDHASLFEFLSLASVFPGLAGKTQDILDITAYDLAFDTGMAPAVGYTRTLTSASVRNPEVISDWTTLEGQAVANADLIAEGILQGKAASLVFEPRANQYVSTVPGTGPFTHAQLLTLIKGADALTVMGVPRGSTGIYSGTGRNAAFGLR